KVAGIVSVGVATGSTSPAALVDAGADVVLPDLVAFPQWLDGFADRHWLDGVDEWTGNR
ncbi:MAG: hypothetical protein QOE57_291, partial [Acidimicrobiaceae bacterium]|nr:hypothetical protein [Acidimicrobiaceae bacterium]